jgi:hypothetical protein
MKKLILMLPVFLLLAGCQTTPDKPVVVQKDMEQMIEKGMSSAEAGSPPASASATDKEGLYKRYGVPERFKAQIKEGKLAVNCDVLIELPDTERLPMARVAAAKFPQEKVYAFFKALCGNTQMYVRPESRDKEYYRQEILKYKAELAAAKDERQKSFCESVIAGLEKSYRKAPEKLDLIPTDGTFKNEKMTEVGIDAELGSYSVIRAMSAPINDNSMTFYARNDAEYDDTKVYTGEDEQGNTHVLAPSSGSSMGFSREGVSTSYTMYWQGNIVSDVTALSLSGGAAKDCALSVTPKEARETVEKFMASLGMDELKTDVVLLCSNQRTGTAAEGGTEVPASSGDGMTGPQAYVFRLLRQLNGVKVESTQGMSQTSIEGEEYGKEWTYESAYIAVDDKGIADFSWEGPLEVKEVMTDNTKILPWPDIESVFKKMMVVKNAEYESIDGYSSVSFDIKHASLSLQRVMERDSFTTGLLVPAWNFYGTTTYAEKEGRSEVIDSGFKPLISINAIDGSVVDVDKGY